MSLLRLRGVPTVPLPPVVASRARALLGLLSDFALVSCLASFSGLARDLRGNVIPTFSLNLEPPPPPWAVPPRALQSAEGRCGSRRNLLPLEGTAGSLFLQRGPQTRPCRLRSSAPTRRMESGGVPLPDGAARSSV